MNNNDCWGLIFESLGLDVMSCLRLAATCQQQRSLCLKYFTLTLMPRFFPGHHHETMESFLKLWFRKTCAEVLGFQGSALTTAFTTWRPDQSGFFWNGGQLLKVEHDSLGEWYLSGSGTKMAISWQQYAEMFRSGFHVPLSAPLLSLFSSFLPGPRMYTISQHIDVPMLQADYGNASTCQKDMWAIYGKPKTMQEACDMPLVHGGMSDRQHSFYFPNLRLFAVCSQATDEAEPLVSRDVTLNTCVLLSSETCDTEWFSVGSMVLDGHHKLRKAALSGAPLRVILLEQRTGNNACLPHRKGAPEKRHSESRPPVFDLEAERAAKKAASPVRSAAQSLLAYLRSLGGKPKRKLKHPISVVDQFLDVGVDPPQRMRDVKDCISRLADLL